MHRNRSSSKRAHSPAVVGEGPSQKIPQLDASHLSKQENVDDRSSISSSSAPETMSPPRMPAFLKLSELAIREKYAKVVRLENERVVASRVAPDGAWARLPADPVLDRYSNIHPWQSNRVKLQVPDGVNDYINASPVSLYSKTDGAGKGQGGAMDTYICMQGPKRETVSHVWHMIWHELAKPFDSSPAVIIMLSPTHALDDSNQPFEKCYQYYPLDEDSPPLIINENNEVGDNFKATIKFASREPDVPGTSIETRKLVMTVEGEEAEKPIWHFLYPDWPDFGALAEENVESILTLMRLTKERNETGENPRVVHCSAGVGRTGTFVALEYLLGELQSGAWEGWDEGDKAGTDPIFDAVNELRMQRKTMVQALEQYAFLYEVLRKLWEKKYKSPQEGKEIEEVVSSRVEASIDGMSGVADGKKGSDGEKPV